MKTIRLFPLLAAAALLAAGCEKAETPNEGEGEGEVTVAVESITVDESIKDGIALEEGKTLDLSELVTVLPEDATDKTVTYTIADEKVATVSAAGLITAVAAGNTNITISAGEQSVKLPLTVTAEEVAITKIEFNQQSMTFASGSEPFDLLQYITVTPAENTDKLTFTSSNESVATVDKDGQLTLVSAGETTVTVSAASDPSVTASATVTVTGDYNRSGWTMTCSEEKLPDLADRNNSLTALLDGDPNTVFCLTRPGKTTGGVSHSGVDTETYEINFTIDMKTVQKVNYFRIDHLSNKTADLGTRMAGFTKILGSTDGTNFDKVLAENLDFSEHSRVLENTSTENIKVTETECQYVKFVMIGIKCYDPGVNAEGADTNNGNSAQMKELYLGYEPAE